MNERDDLDVLRRQLLVVRDQIDVALAMIGTPAAPACPHPVEQRKYVPGTMGGPATFNCSACGETVTQTAAEVAAEQGA